MSSRRCFPVYIGHGNIMSLTPFADITTEERLDMSGALDVTVCIEGADASNSTAPDTVWWELDDPMDPDSWVIRVRPGLIPGLVAGEQAMRVIAYDADFTDGLVLTDTLCVNVVGAC